MLVNAVHLPKAYDSSEDPLGQMYEALVLNLLVDAQQGTLLFVDQEGTLRKAMTSYLDRWDVNKRKRAKELLANLDKRRRILRLPTTGVRPPGTECRQPGCSQALHLTSAYQTDLVIRPTACPDVHLCDRGPGHFMDPVEYASYRGREDLTAAQSFRCTPGEFTASQIEDLVWKPLLRHCRKLTIVDYALGSHIVAKVSGLREDTIREATVNPGYRSTARWVVEQMHATAPVTADERELTIYTGIRTNLVTPARRDDVLTALKRLEDDLQVVSRKVKVRIVVKAETTAAHLEHARFLATDQFAFVLDRGMELLDDKGNVREVILRSLTPKEYRAGMDLINDLTDLIP
jgi:hypothetical protein